MIIGRSSISRCKAEVVKSRPFASLRRTLPKLMLERLSLTVKTSCRMVPSVPMGVSLASETPIGTDGTILQLVFTVNESLSSINFGSVRLNDANGRDFTTSALQREIELLPMIIGSDQYQLYLPAVIR